MTESTKVISHKELLDIARTAMEKSYSPYSKYRVGAALLTKEGKVVPGCNVEVVSFDGTCCAERTAICSAVAQGHREFTTIAIIAEQHPEVWPCGMCRQFLAEFGLNIVVVVPGKDGSVKTLTVKDLLPYQFDTSELLH